MPRPIYSDEVQEIMGRIPGRVVRWGISVIFSIFVILLGVAYFFKYPEIVTSSIVLTTTNPPTELIARSTGKVEHILVENGQSVLPNELIAVLVQYGRLPVRSSIGKSLVGLFIFFKYRKRIF